MRYRLQRHDGTDCSATMVPITVLRMVPIQRYRHILEGQRNVMIGIHNDEVVYVPFSEAIKKDKPLDKSLIKVLDELSI